MKGPLLQNIRKWFGKRPRVKPGLCILFKIVKDDQQIGLGFIEGPPKNYREFPHLIVFNLAYFGDWPDKERFARFHIFEDALYELLQDAALHPLHMFFDGGKRWYVYARDREAFLSKSRPLVEEFADCWASTEEEYDPTWRIYRDFENEYRGAEKAPIN